MEKKPSILNSSMGITTVAIIFDGPHFIKYPLLIAAVVLLVMGIQEQQQIIKDADHSSNNNSTKH
jgi:hypothetical protein